VKHAIHPEAEAEFGAAINYYKNISPAWASVSSGKWSE
jgi:hypothetical protein